MYTDIITVDSEQRQLRPEMKRILLSNLYDGLAVIIPALMKCVGTLAQEEAGVIGDDLAEMLKAKRNQYRR